MLMDINALQELLGTKDAQRYLMLKEPAITEKTRKQLTRLMLNNRLVKLRRDIRHYLKESRQIMHEKNSYRKHLKTNPRNKAAEKMFRLLDKQEQNYQKMLELCGKSLLMFLPFYESVATDHDFAQILNANIREVELYREDYSKRVSEGNGKPDDFFTALIFVYKIEPDDDCPFMEALWQAFYHAITDNKELKERVWNKAEECFPELRGCMVTVTQDENGKLIGEKYYPPLKLIK